MVNIKDRTDWGKTYKIYLTKGLCKEYIFKTYKIQYWNKQKNIEMSKTSTDTSMDNT